MQDLIEAIAAQRVVEQPGGERDHRDCNAALQPGHLALALRLLAAQCALAREALAGCHYCAACWTRRQLNLEIDHQRQVIGGDARQRRAHGLDTRHMDAGPDKGIVDAQRRKARRKSRLIVFVARTMRVMQPPGQFAIAARARLHIEVAHQHHRVAAVRMPEPFFAQQAVDLFMPLARHQSEMGIDHLQLAAADRDRRPDRAARLEPAQAAAGRAARPPSPGATGRR